jgi:hypothetical protein
MFWKDIRTLQIVSHTLDFIYRVLIKKSQSYVNKSGFRLSATGSYII